MICPYLNQECDSDAPSCYECTLYIQITEKNKQKEE